MRGACCRMFLGVLVLSLLAVPALPLSAEDVVIRAPISGTGTSSIMLRYIATKGIDKKFGLSLDASQTYESMVTYYQDFFQGNHDMAVATPDTLAARYLTGAPVHMIGTFCRGNVASLVVRTDGGIDTIRDLKGKLVAVPTGTGTYRMSQAFLKKFYNLEFGKDIAILNVPGAAQGPTYVGAKRADGALSWEPAISIAMYRAKNMKVLTTMDRIFKEHTGHELFYFVIAMRADKLKAKPGLAARVVSMFQEAAREFEANPDEALTLAAKTLEIDKAAMLEAVKAGRLTFDVRSAGDPRVAASMQYQLDFLADNGLLERRVPPGFLFSDR